MQETYNVFPANAGVSPIHASESYDVLMSEMAPMSRRQARRMARDAQCSARAAASRARWDERMRRPIRITPASRPLLITMWVIIVSLTALSVVMLIGALPVGLLMAAVTAAMWTSFLPMRRLSIAARSAACDAPDVQVATIGMIKGIITDRENFIAPMGAVYVVMPGAGGGHTVIVSDARHSAMASVRPDEEGQLEKFVMAIRAVGVRPALGDGDAEPGERG